MADVKKKIIANVCTACGGNLKKASRIEGSGEDQEKIPIAKCNACGKEYDQYTQEYYQVYEDSFLPGKKNRSIFELGLKGEIDGMEYEVIGRIRYQDEDDYELSVWDEWLAVDSDGVYHWFVEEDNVITAYTDYIPDAMDFNDDKSFITFEKTSIAKSEGYVARIVFSEGELTWEPEIGEPLTMYDFKISGQFFTIEKSDDEISVSAGRKIPFKKALMAFRKNEFTAKYDHTLLIRKQFRRKMYLYFLLCAVSLGFTVRGCLSGDRISNIDQTRLVIAENESVIEDGKSMFNSEMLVGPVSLLKQDGAYRIKIEVDKQVQDLDQEWQSCAVMLVKEDRIASIASDKNKLKDFFEENESSWEPAESYTFLADFWDEQGYDEGYWRESDTSLYKDFVLDDPGMYYIYVNANSERSRQLESLRVSMEENIKGGFFFIFAFGLFLILAVMGWSKSKSYNELPFPFYE